MKNLITAGATLHCNRAGCQAAFPAPVEMERQPFAGASAARVNAFCQCPHCGAVDAHWVYASDGLMPAFTGGFDARKSAERRWLREN